jgi:zinc protease
MGFWEDVVDMPNQYEYSLTFFDRFYRPEYSTLLVVGDVTPEQVNQLADKYFGSWQRGSYAPEIPVEPEQNGTRFAHVQNADFPPYIGLNFKSPGFAAGMKENAALELISSLLFSERSDLYKKLVIEERKCRNLRSGYFLTRDPYLFTAGASIFKEEDLQYVKDEMIKAIDSLKAGHIDPQLLSDTKSHLRYSFAMDLNSSTSIAETLSYVIWVSGDPAMVNPYYDEIEKLTVADLREIAGKYLVPEKLTLSTISPEEEGGVL